MTTGRRLSAMLNSCRRLAAAIVSILGGVSIGPSDVQAQLCVQLTGAAYTQTFNSLATSGSASSMPMGFAFIESGAGSNSTYVTSDGTLSAANTYSFGAFGNVDRALGEITSSGLQTTCGACFINNTGLLMPNFTISYTGEQWRLGAADATPDRLDFQFSTNATSLITGTWTDVDTLDFGSPINAGALGSQDGNAAANRVALAPTAIVPPAPIVQGATFFIRWIPTNIFGNDALAIDDFKLRHTPTSDFDIDGDIDGSDFLQWQRGLGINVGASITNGDANQDGSVDALDLAIWRIQLPLAAPNVPVLAAGILAPEPPVSPPLFAVLAILTSVRTRFRR